MGPAVIFIGGAAAYRAIDEATTQTAKRLAPGSEVFPYVVTTNLLTEHHTAGGMSRGLPYLASCNPSSSAR